MPRKTDGIVFELHPRPTQDDSGNPLLYARPSGDMKRTLKDVEAYSFNRGVSSGMMTLSFESFIDVCSEWLAQGFRIETPFGTFSPKLRLTGDFSDPSKVKGSDVEFAGIELTPSRHFIKSVKNKVKGFRKSAGPVGNAHMHDEALMTDALRRSTVSGYTTIRRFQSYSGLKYHSAQRYLDRQCLGDHPRLRKVKIGSAYQYFIIED